MTHKDPRLIPTGIDELNGCPYVGYKQTQKQSYDWNDVANQLQTDCYDKQQCVLKRIPPKDEWSEPEFVCETHRIFCVEHAIRCSGYGKIGRVALARALHEAYQKGVNSK